MLTSKIAIPSGTLLGTASSAILNPAFESELLNDIAHVCLDLSSFLRPATPFLRLTIVLGRVCAILSDYLPNGCMKPEEVAFQAIMLLVASYACVQSFLPLLSAMTAKISYWHGRAYTKMFQSLGVTWTQYKAMVAVALDWVGELRFAQLLDKSKSMEGASPSTKIQAGGTGATLFRIHIKKLKLLMDHDPELAESIHSLLLKDMHKKLSTLSMVCVE